MNRIIFLILAVNLVLVASSPCCKHVSLYPAQSTNQKPRDKPAMTEKRVNLRKGEYVCGDKVCKLKPGEEPPGCDGVCQYPLRLQ